MEHFKSAFPQQHTHLLNCGYPRIRYLLDKQSDQPYISFIKKELKLDPQNKHYFMFLHGKQQMKQPICYQ